MSRVTRYFAAQRGHWMLMNSASPKRSSGRSRQPPRMGRILSRSQPQWKRKLRVSSRVVSSVSSIFPTASASSAASHASRSPAGRRRGRNSRPPAGRPGRGAVRIGRKTGRPSERVLAFDFQRREPRLGLVLGGGLGVEEIPVRLADVFGEDPAGDGFFERAAGDKQIDPRGAEIHGPGDGLRPRPGDEVEGEHGERVLEHLVELGRRADAVLHQVQVVVGVDRRELAAEHRALRCRTKMDSTVMNSSWISTCSGWGTSKGRERSGGIPNDNFRGRAGDAAGSGQSTRGRPRPVRRAPARRRRLRGPGGGSRSRAAA